MHNWNLIWAMFGLVAFLLVLVLVVIYFGRRLQIPPRKQRGSSGANPQTPSQTPDVVNPAPAANDPAAPAAPTRNLSYVLRSTLGFIVVLAIFAGLGWFLWLVVPPGFRAVKNWAARIGTTTPSVNVSEQNPSTKARHEEVIIAPAYNCNNKWSKPVNVAGKKCKYFHTEEVFDRIDRCKIVRAPSAEEVKNNPQKNLFIGNPIEIEFMSCSDKEVKVCITWEDY